MLGINASPVTMLLLVTTEALAVALWIVVARSIHDSQWDKESSRLLLIAATVNVLSCCVLAGLLGSIWLWQLLRREHMEIGQFLGIALMFVLPARGLWNYALAARFIRRKYAISRLAPANVPESVRQACGYLGIASIEVGVSSNARVPYVFGRSSRKAMVVIPEAWCANPSETQTVALVHELAHVANKDIGFITWAYSFLRGAYWPSLIGVALMVAMLIGKEVSWRLAAVPTILHTLASAELAILFAVVSRRRELIADKVTSSIVRSGMLEAARETVDTTPLVHLGTDGNRTLSTARLLHATYRYLHDKALFGRSRYVWEFLFRAFSYIYLVHPPSAGSERVSTDGRPVAPRSDAADLEVCFWTGVSAGTFLVVVMLAGALWAILVEGHRTGTEFLDTSMRLFLSVGLGVAGYLSCAMVLPGWNSPVGIPWRLALRALLFRHLVALLGALLALPLLGLTLREEFPLLAAGGVFLTLQTVFVSMTFATIKLKLWEFMRYWTRQDRRELLAYLYVTAPGVALMLVVAVASIVFMFKGPLAAAAPCFGVAAVCAWYRLFSAGGLFSQNDEYLILRFGRTWKRVDVQRFTTWTWLVVSLAIWVPLAIVFGITVIMVPAFFRLMGFTDNSWTIFFVGPLVMFVSICFTWGQTRRGDYRVGSRRVILELSRSMQLLGQRPTCTDQLVRVRDRELRRLSESGKSREMPLTASALYACAGAVESAGHPEGWPLAARQWILLCENGVGGFGVWPGASSRLSSTYYALAGLTRLAAKTMFSGDEHVAWINGCWLSEGGFRSPHSNWPGWADSLFAVESLRLCGVVFDGVKWDICASWARVELHKGLTEDCVETVCGCVKILRTIGRLDDMSSEAVREWLQPKLRQLAILKPASAAEWIRNIVETTCLVFEDSQENPLHEIPIEVVASRLDDALAAEMRGI